MLEAQLARFGTEGVAEGFAKICPLGGRVCGFSDMCHGSAPCISSRRFFKGGYGTKVFNRKMLCIGTSFGFYGSEPKGFSLSAC